ncbi:hypothetical protein GUITHDRAFT_160289 [Guillardia theta CCMP2712]|uniref:Uncharacterized protein n=1 Tax=Guillardia theta (strain CCMP2712) TaxID=905079 RepID=L1IBW3_GUITC|nr:hypothetical protein GUITHDRAFT_160289 [Guillardia theta CCMP2712]EKX33409.1 hypothetical protein GUITHDRAFT_160289 [Guillardia theta CCMP2712]|eukprot:XP_005820389.1 hypothetical protein GUITHDRAFT_160289 [Guillardia theta CCMP2712]
MIAQHTLKSLPPLVDSKQECLNIQQRQLQFDELVQHETIGTGTFGRVKLCRHAVTGFYYAMKILSKGEVLRLKQWEHVQSEKEILQKIQHPFIVQLHGKFHDSKNLYLVLELALGGELFWHLRNCARFPNETARFYASQIALALEYLHSKNIIYRDLKPENLLLDEQGYIKLTDFGLAKEITDRTWTLCGTPEYLAPEVIKSKGHGKAVDWWTFGILIFEMLAGYPPFYADNTFAIYQKILLLKVDYPKHFDPQAKDIIRKLLQSDRTKRIGNLKGGADDVKKHKWFKGLSWDYILRKQIPAPIVPKIRHAADTSNFEQYQDDDEQVYDHSEMTRL